MSVWTAAMPTSMVLPGRDIGEAHHTFANPSMIAGSYASHRKLRPGGQTPDWGLPVRTLLEIQPPGIFAHDSSHD
jgi:hypothetical protein